VLTEPALIGEQMLTRSLLDGDFKHSGIRKDIDSQFEGQPSAASDTLEKSAVKRFIDACEWLLFLVFYIVLIGGMLVYGFPFMVK
jgi:hypothetical protein